MKNRTTIRYTLELFSIIYFHSSSNNSPTRRLTTHHTCQLLLHSPWVVDNHLPSRIQKRRRGKYIVYIMDSHAWLPSHVLICICCYACHNPLHSCITVLSHRNDMIEAQLKQDRQLSRSVLYALLTFPYHLPTTHPFFLSLSSRRDLQCIACLPYQRGAFVPRVSPCVPPTGAMYNPSDL